MKWEEEGTVVGNVTFELSKLVNDFRVVGREQAICFWSRAEI